MFWFVDAHTKGFQRLTIKRAHAIQIALRTYMVSGALPAGFVGTETVADLFEERAQSTKSDQLGYVIRSGLRGNVLLFYLVLQCISIAAIFVALMKRIAT